jgi:hypothetical protein
MSARYYRHTVNLISISIPVLILLIGLQVMLMMLWVGGMPNQVTIPPVQHADIYLSLWHNRPYQALMLTLVEKPLFVIQSRQLDDGLDMQLWAVSLFAGNLILHLFISLYLALILQKPQMSTWPQWRWRGPGLFLVILAMITIRRADCCVGGPGWLFDVWLLSYLSYTQTTLDWQSWYVEIKPWFIYLQSLLVFCGVLMLYRAHHLRHDDTPL